METRLVGSQREVGEEMEETKAGQGRWSKGRGPSVCLSDLIVVPLAVLSLFVEREPFLFSNSWENVSQTFLDSDIKT